MIRNYLLLLSTIFLLACYSERPLTPSEMETVGDRFPFPQGTGFADEVFQRIYQRTGSKVIYRDFTEAHVNRTWVYSTPLGIARYTWNMFDTQETAALDAAAVMLENKVFGLLPDNILRLGLQGFPYLYFAEGGIRIHDSRFAVHRTNALDAMTISLNPTAELDHYMYQVFFPARIAMQIFAQAFYRGAMTLPDSWFTDIGDVTPVHMVSYSIAARDPDRFENFWARQGRIPFILLSGQINIGRNTGPTIQAEIPALRGRYRDVPWFFLYLSIDGNWRERFEPGGIFYNCPRLYRRLNTFYDTMLGYGINFSEIHRKLFEGTEIDTSIDRVWIQGVSTGSARSYIFRENNSMP